MLDVDVDADAGGRGERQGKTNTWGHYLYSVQHGIQRTSQRVFSLQESNISSTLSINGRNDARGMTMQGRREECP